MHRNSRPSGEFSLSKNGRTAAEAIAGGLWSATTPMTSNPRLRRYDGPAILSHGFRLFFLFGAIYSGVVVLVWLPVYLRLEHVPGKVSRPGFP